ncbi:hypothetical protein BKA82DRAFT_445892 [Pisolithus tinctorius]|uniref:Uncharacterized protein n=1 Tax=Pisolithus tinctorius Marx 270 TaxID=870435 RepID=A0A0C3JXJ3_PISTI|nr:hypothetical protein BKA82DRAFT_445892 [Pisolithus tinctorius]KIO13828.1 hypothetical protein M404DRAFT_445892 [Pisolithus tinctorius Marx 270]
MDSCCIWSDSSSIAFAVVCIILRGQASQLRAGPSCSAMSRGRRGRAKSKAQYSTYLGHLGHMTTNAVFILWGSTGFAYADDELRSSASLFPPNTAAGGPTFALSAVWNS